MASKPFVIRIPPVHRPPLAKLRDMDQADFDTLYARLESAPAFSPLSELPGHAQVDCLTEVEARDIVLAVVALYGQSKFFGVTMDDLAEGVAESPDFQTDDDQAQSRLTERLRSLLGTGAIDTTGRAVDLLGENEHLYHASRVLTDIRPVFGSDPLEAPTGAIIAETLKLEYLDEGEIRSLYVALDEKDLLQLQSTVERAVDKIKTLKQLVGDVGLTEFTVNKDDEGESAEA